LRQLLSGQLTEAAASDVTQHVENCPSCCRDLEQLAADPRWWQEARRFLAEDDAGQDTDDTNLVPESQGAGSHDEADTIRELVTGYFEPADDPAIIGRLDQYDILGIIGHGGMGVVLKSHDRQLNRHVAIKVLAPHYATSASARQRFAREAQAAAAVVHPNVLAIHAVCGNSRLPYLVMPYVVGQSLQQRIDRQGPLDVKDVLRIGMQTAEGLAAAHAQGLVHRDVKPANILLEHGVQRVLLTDFGLARAIDDASMTRSGVIAGTPQYMSPEQARGEPVDFRTDLFSLGSVLYALCAGRPPFRAETTMGVLRRICDVPPRSLQEVNPDVPAWLASIVHRLLAQAPQDRFPSARDVAHLLARCLAHVQHPTAVPLPDALSESTERHRLAALARPWRVAAVSAVVLLAVAAATGSWLLGPHDGKQMLETQGANAADAGTDSPPSQLASPGLLEKQRPDPEILWNDGIEDQLHAIQQDLQRLEYLTDSEDRR
jgi:serine/threonine-protein kinase